MRIKWLSANISEDQITSLKRKMLEFDYNDASDGFRLESAEYGKLIGKYIIKKDEVNTALDPFGNEYSYKTIQYDIYRFIIRNSTPQITLIDPPRALNVFLNKLSYLTNHEIVISQINLDINMWLLDVCKEHKNMKVIKFVSSGIMLSNTITGKIILSGTEDVRCHINRLTDKKDIIADKVRIRLEDKSIEIEMSRNGSATLFGKYIDNSIVDSISKTICELHKEVAN